MNAQTGSWPAISSTPEPDRRRRSPRQRGRADGHDSQDLARHLLRAQEEERWRIASELHDGINHEVAMLSMGLGLALACAGENQLRERLIEIRNRAIRISEEIRRISHRLRPALLEYAGFTGAVRSHCRDLSESAGLRVELMADDAVSIPAEAATVCYRIVQEALQNVVRHAGATAVTVRVEERHGSIVLSVEDNGVGFAREMLPPGSGMGLASMRERARSLGGELVVRKAGAHGTRVEAVIPLQGSSK